MTRSDHLPPEVIERLRELDPAAGDSGSSPERLGEVSALIMGDSLASPMAPTELTGPREVRPSSALARGGRQPPDRRLLLVAGLVLVLVVAAGVISNHLRSTTPLIAAPPLSATPSATISLRPPAAGEKTARVLGVEVQGLQVTLSWENGRCGDEEPLTERLVRAETQPTPEGLAVLVVVQDNPARQPGPCRGVGITSTVTVTLVSPLERAVVLDQSTTPAQLVVPRTSEPVPIATYVPLPSVPSSLEQLTGALVVDGGCLYLQPANGQRTIALLPEGTFQWTAKLLLVGVVQAYRPGDTLTLTGFPTTWSQRPQTTKYVVPAACDTKDITFMAVDQ